MTRPVWIRVGKLVDGLSDQFVQNANVVFDARAIRFVGNAEQLPSKEMLTPGQSEPDAVLDDVTMLPTLIEAHAHLFLDGAPVESAQREAYLKQDAATLLERGRSRWKKILAQGVGAVRDAGDKHGVGLALARESKLQRDGLRKTPYIDSPGAAIHHKGRYGAFMGAPIEDHASPEACVRARIADGADRIKLLVSGIINFKEGKVTTPPQMPIDEVRALVTASRERGRQTFAHASGTDGVEHSIEGGVNTVEHGFFITEDQLAKMRDRDIAWVPTFAPVQLQIDRASDLGWSDEIVGHLKRIIASHQDMLRKAHERGVTIIAGSDAGSCGVPHAVGLLDEMSQMERAGMPTLAVLRSATGASAATLDFPEPIGTIAPGRKARFILTSNDPTSGVSNLRKPKSVYFDGRLIESGDSSDLAGL